MIDKLLEKAGLKYEDLSPVEKETLNVWSEALQKGQISVEGVREYISAMKAAVEQEISKEPTFIRIFIFKVENPQIIRLQARLRNYMLLDAFLSTPEKAREQMENAIAGIARGKVI